MLSLHVLGFRRIIHITPPTGSVDSAYKMNRLTGGVWFLKTYTKQIGTVRVLAAREVEIEQTKELQEGDLFGRCRANGAFQRG